MSANDSRLGFILSAIRGGKMGANEYRVLNVPRAAVYFNGGQTIPTGTSTTVTWDSLDYDTDNMWNSAASSANKFTINTPGLYLCQGLLNFAGSAVGYRQIWFLRNGAYVAGYDTTYDMNGFAGANNLQTSWPLVLNKDDTIQLQCVQNSGGVLAVNACAAAGPRYNGFAVTLLSTL